MVEACFYCPSTKTPPVRRTALPAGSTPSNSKNIPAASPSGPQPSALRTQTQFRHSGSPIHRPGRALLPWAFLKVAQGAQVRTPHSVRPSDSSPSLCPQGSRVHSGKFCPKSRGHKESLGSHTRGRSDSSNVSPVK